MSIVFLLAALFLTSRCHGVQVKNELEFECVDIHKQPAFDNVLLKNHRIQRSPSSLPKFKRNNKSSFTKFKFSNFDAPTKGCPPGMVPIQRTQMNHKKLTELRSVAKLHTGINNIQPLTADKPGRHFAVMSTTLGAFGGSALISVHNPPAKMNQVSMSQVWIESGEGAKLNSIQVGWAVHPRLYGDNLTHITAYWTADGSRKTGCYNMDCPGFVQVHPTYRLGQPFQNISVPDGPQYATVPFVYLDTDTKNWWLALDENVKVGYWPKELFNSLNEGITVVQFGGWTFNSPDGVSPPMGSGQFPDNRYRRSSYFAQLQVIDEDGVLTDAAVLRKFVDNSSCYDLKDWGNQGGKLQQTFTYGGPGGVCGI